MKKKQDKRMALIEVGISLIFIGIIIIIFGSISQATKTDSKTKVAFGGFIGPIPFGFGNDKQLVYFVIILSAVIFILFAVLNYLNYLK
jgi:uncharacterized protein (TIGR00304 family)